MSELERNWIDDFKHENGNYNCICVFCKQDFIGHKRRVVCKVCSDEKGLTPKIEQSDKCVHGFPEGEERFCIHYINKKGKCPKCK